MKSVPGTATLIIDKHQPQILAFQVPPNQKLFFRLKIGLTIRLVLPLHSLFLLHTVLSTPFILHIPEDERRN
jgi:hypothetical protein